MPAVLARPAALLYAPGAAIRLCVPDARPSVCPSGSPAELCRLRPDDEIVAVNGLPVARMSRSQWTETMASSLQTGSVTMDVRRYGSKGEGASFFFTFL